MALANRSNGRRHRKPSVSRLTRSSKQRKEQNAGGASGMAGCWRNCCFILNNIPVLHDTRHVALEIIYFASSTLSSIPAKDNLTLR